MNNGSTTTEAATFGIGTFLLGVLAGAVVGGITALLLAPKTGAETRDLCMTQLNRLRDVVRSKTPSETEETTERMTG